MGKHFRVGDAMFADELLPMMEGDRYVADRDDDADEYGVEPDVCASPEPAPAGTVCEWCEEPITDAAPGFEHGTRGWHHCADACSDHVFDVGYLAPREDFHADG